MDAVFESVGEGIERIALRTPTLPPATTTCSYIIHHGTEFYVVEPATPHSVERRLLFEGVRRFASRGGVLRGAILTHHHGDHVGAAEAFRTEFGAPIFAHAITRAKLRGHVTVDQTLDEGGTLLDGTIELLHTPGHAPGHLCLWQRSDAWLIAGDMVASVGTIIVDPDDDGDMAQYVAQLERLAALPIRRILPAHGEPVDSPHELLRFYIDHRRAREAAVLSALPTGTAEADLAEVVERAYADTPKWLWPLASKSARAHLSKLERDGLALKRNDGWTRTPDA